MGIARNLSSGNGEIRGRRSRVGKRFLERGQQARGPGESCKLPWLGLGRTPDHFGRTESPENVYSGC